MTHASHLFVYKYVLNTSPILKEVFDKWQSGIIGIANSLCYIGAVPFLTLAHIPFSQGGDNCEHFRD
jgi:hypothetical protein